MTPFRRLLITGIFTLSLAGCLELGGEATMSDEGGVSTQDASGSRVSSTTGIQFDPENEVLPFPNNLLFEAGAESNSDFDGTLNVPVADPDGASADLINGVNALDGFSTIGAWRLAFDGPVDESTLNSSIRVFRLDMGDADTHASRVRPEGVKEEMVVGEDFELDYDKDAGVLKIIPAEPLGYNEYYSVLVTDGLRDPEGNTVASPLQWDVALGESQVEEWCPDGESYKPDAEKPDRALLQCMTHFAVEPVASSSGTGISREDLIMGWGITTQRKDRTFNDLADFITNDLGSDLSSDEKERMLTLFDAGSAELQEGELPLVQDLKSSLDEDSAGPRTPGGKARVFPGVVRVPYWLDEPADGMSDHIAETDSDGNRVNDGAPLDDDAPEGSKWSCDEGSCDTDSNRNSDDPSTPDWKHTQDVQIVLSLPDSEQDSVPDGPYPVVIFHHPIQQDRSTALAIADELAEQGYAAVGIDMPLHGIVPHMLDPEDDATEGRISLYAPALNEAIDEAEEMFGERPLPLHYERHFYLNLLDPDEYAEDYAKEDYSAEDPDQQQYINKDIDASGQHFLVPDTPLSQRDILRQGGLDLVALAHYLRNGWLNQTCLLQKDSDGVLDDFTSIFSDSGIFENDDENMALLDESQLDDETLVDNCTADLKEEIDFDEIHFASHSLSNVVAAPFLAYDAEIETVSHLTPVGGVMRSLEGSETIGPILREGLAEEADLEPGDEDYYRFFTLVQGALDAVDPLNLAEDIANPVVNDEGDRQRRPVYLSQILGNDGSDGTGENPPDLVLPPEVEGWPLAGSTPLARQMGLGLRPDAEDEESGDDDIVNRNDDGDALQAAIGFRYGSHASPLLDINEDDDPRDNGQDTFDIPNGSAVHTEMQHQLGSFLNNGGERIEQVDTDLVKTRD